MFFRTVLLFKKKKKILASFTFGQTAVSNSSTLGLHANHVPRLERGWRQKQKACKIQIFMRPVTKKVKRPSARNHIQGRRKKRKGREKWLKRTPWHLSEDGSWSISFALLVSLFQISSFHLTFLFQNFHYYYQRYYYFIFLGFCFGCDVFYLNFEMLKGVCG